MKDVFNEDAILARFEQLGSEVSHVGVHSSEGGVPFRQSLLPDRFQGGYRRWGKRSLDLLMVLASLPIVLPVTLICAVALWIESGFPFFVQDRLGRNGRIFRIAKLRTMIRDADEQFEKLLASDPALRDEWDRTQKLQYDPRITRLGAVLRATSLDELPQLWNVFKGEMSLVGPRPMLPEQLEMYGDARAYFALRPGLTGAWQVTARNDRSFDSRAPMDADYHTYHSLRQDMQIIWRTVGVVLNRSGC